MQDFSGHCRPGFTSSAVCVIRFRQKNPTLVKVRKSSLFQFNVSNVNTLYLVLQVTFDFVNIQPRPHLSLTITKWLECLNITIKTFNHTLVATSGYWTWKLGIYVNYFLIMSLKKSNFSVITLQLKCICCCKLVYKPQTLLSRNTLSSSSWQLHNGADVKVVPNLSLSPHLLTALYYIRSNEGKNADVCSCNTMFSVSMRCH